MCAVRAALLSQGLVGRLPVHGKITDKRWMAAAEVLRRGVGGCFRVMPSPRS